LINNLIRKVSKIGKVTPNHCMSLDTGKRGVIEREANWLIKLHKIENGKMNNRKRWEETL
jgi:hypothetical protein